MSPRLIVLLLSGLTISTITRVPAGTTAPAVRAGSGALADASVCTAGAAGVAPTAADAVACARAPGGARHDNAAATAARASNDGMLSSPPRHYRSQLDRRAIAACMRPAEAAAPGRSERPRPL